MGIGSGWLTARKAGLFTVVAWLLAAFHGAAQPLPAASNVVQRLVERSRQVAQKDEERHYTYEKRSIMAELDAQEGVVKSTERIFRVILIGGLPFQRLVKVQGRELTPKELEKETQRENAFRQRISGIDLHKKSARKEGMVTREIVDRFRFETVRRETVEGRPTLVLVFKAKAAGEEGGSIEEKLLNRMTGQLWVDEEDSEVVKVDAVMLGPVSIGWIVASLQKCALSLERRRLPDGVWVNVRSSFVILGRKLFSAMRFRTTEESSGYHRQ